MHRPRRFPRPLAVLALAVAAAAPGCYRNVVGASGPGSEHYDVHEANIREGESVWSEPQPKVREPDRYSGGTVSRAKPIPTQAAPQKPQD